MSDAGMNMITYFNLHDTRYLDTAANFLHDTDPIIFRGLKSLTLKDTQQTSLLELASKGISVYCPHTAVDAAEGGNADWLADIVTAKCTRPERQKSAVGPTADWVSPDAAIYAFPRQLSEYSYELAALPHTRRPIVPNPSNSKAGMGRIVSFSAKKRAELPTLPSILLNLHGYLGRPAAISVALPQVEDETSKKFRQIRGIGICAGSGSLLNSLVAGEEGEEIDLLLTGELSHHEVLAATERGKMVICLGHSNSERGYLSAVMQQNLVEGLKDEGYSDDDHFKVLVSEADRDPFMSLVVQ